MELLDVYDQHGMPTGMHRLRGEKFLPGEYHLATSLWIVNPSGQLLIQKRSATVTSSPNKWGITGGAVHSAESSTNACLRETYEEIGLQLCPEDIHLLYRHIAPKVIFDDFITIRDFPIEQAQLQAEEVSAIAWVTPDELRELFHTGEFTFMDFSVFDQVITYMDTHL